MTNENAKASAKSTARCRFAGANRHPAFAGVAMLCALGVGINVGCDDPLRPGAGTGGGGGGGGTGGAGGGTGGTGAGTGGTGAGTGGTGEGTGGTGEGTGGTSGAGAGGSGGLSGACPNGPGLALGVASRANEGAAHTIICGPVSYLTVPPSSGAHYPSWPAYKTYAQPVPWGFLVHGLEHGAVEVVYNCPGGCPDEVTAAQAWIDALAPDANCAGARPRVILAPDPTLDVRWAAAAWTWTLRACSFDRAVFQKFFEDHYNGAPESICAQGADQSATGWCP